MQNFTAILTPLILLFVGIFALFKKCDVYDALVCGAENGLRVLGKILPSVTALFCAIYMLRTSGALDFLCTILSPITDCFGIPKECAPLMLIRPLSGSAALAFGSEIIKSCGVNSLAGRTAAVMLGASETTFYTLAVYFGSIGAKKTRYTLPAALLAEMAGFIAAALSVRLLF